MDPHDYNPANAKHAALYGTDVQGRLMSGYMGHYTCFPQFGNSPEEFEAAGYGQHGEAIIVPWERLPGAGSESGGAELSMRARLPHNQYTFERQIRLRPGETVAHVTETAQNLMGIDRPHQWNQHVTFGPPFAEVGRMWADASIETATVPEGGDWRAFTGTTSPWQMQRSKPRNWVTAYNENFRVLFGQIFDAEQNPWLLDWQTDRQMDTIPTPLRGAVARGFCWGDSISSSIKSAVAQGETDGVPTFSWIGPHAKRTQDYAIFLAEIPEGWRGTAEVEAGSGRVVITERGGAGARTITLQAGGF